MLGGDGHIRNGENPLIAKARGRERHAGKSILMKFLPTVVCGVLLVLPLTVTGAFAQSSTQSATQSSSPTKSTKAQASPTGQSATSPSNRNIGSLTPGTPTPPANPITMAQTRELLDLMGY